MSRTVKCYGGPYHGKEVTLADNCCRFDVADILIQELPRWDASILHEPPTYNVLTYSLRECREMRVYPRRHRSFWVAVVDGSELMPREEHKIRMDLIHKVPWEIPTASIIHDFDQWFASAVYHHLGMVTWKGSRWAV